LYPTLPQPKFSLGVSKRYVDSTVDIDDLSNAFNNEPSNGNGKIQLKDIHEYSSSGMKVG